MAHQAEGLPGETAGEQRRRSTWLVLCLALVSRLGIVWFVVTRMPEGWFYTRGVEMGFLANSLLDGKGLSSPFGIATGATAMIAPAYPVLVAGIFRVLGRYTGASSLCIMVVHALLNVLTIWLLMRLARRFAGELGALLIGIFCACSLPLVWMPTIFWETNLSAALLVGAVTLALEISADSTWPRWLGYGLLCGCCGLVNPALLPAVVSLAGWAAYQAGRQSHRKVLLAGVLFLVVLSPWPIRNARAFHTLVVTRTTAGLELWMGNRPGATGYLDESVFPMFNPAELTSYRTLGEIRYTNDKAALAWRYMFSHPAGSLRLSLVRVWRFWTGTGNSSGSLFYLLHAVTTTLFGAIGLYFLLRSGWRSAAPALWIPMLLFPVPYYLTHAEFRYRLVLDPLLCILAAYGLANLLRPCEWCWAVLRQRERSQVAAAA